MSTASPGRELVRSGIRFWRYGCVDRPVNESCASDRREKPGKALVESVRAESLGYRMQKNVWPSGGKTLSPPSPDRESAG
jgi:hypothetical protein